MLDASEVLKSQGYVLFEEVQHAEFGTFLSSKKWQSFTILLLYYAILILFLAVTFFYIFHSSYTVFSSLIYFAAGVFLAFMLVPFHEYIHYTTYRFLGASNVVITPYLKKGYILTRANHFIVTRDNVKWITLTPFVIISTIGLSSLLFLSHPWNIIISAAIFFHTTLCRADFQILDFVISNKNELALYDDVSKSTTYIYRKTNSGEILID